MRKHHLLAPANDRPSRRVHIEHPVPSSSNPTAQPWAESVTFDPAPFPLRIEHPAPSSSNPIAQPWAKSVALDPAPFPDTGTPPPTPARQMARPLLQDRLRDLDIIHWQSEIGQLPEVKSAPDAKIRGRSPDELAAFLVKALNCLASKTPVPSNDDELEISAKIESIYSLLVNFPQFVL